ncbi:unnamed protein product [Arabis nemorensis]|uniref:Uncharacterized protein n=1 Tax=Arabis nemorensis TaxID=586526 RepID=A0A565BFU9_9BRAS|nr:unnamed protein product [Arabis nemorensis]
MFAGMRQLDKIMSYGRTEGIHRGLGYNGRYGSEAKDIKFVAANVSLHPVCRTEGTTVHRTGITTTQSIGYYFCGRHGHIRALCYKYWERIRRLIYEGKFTWNGFHNQIWVKKADLRSTGTESGSGRASGRGFQASTSRGGPGWGSRFGIRCNMAVV